MKVWTLVILIVVSLAHIASAQDKKESHHEHFYNDHEHDEKVEIGASVKVNKSSLEILKDLQKEMFDLFSPPSLP